MAKRTPIDRLVSGDAGLADLLGVLRELIQQGRQQVLRAVNAVQV